MNILHSIILGIVEGVTEFLPISSTFHQIFIAKLLGIQQNEFTKLFEVVIQGGAILSVVILYSQELLADRDLLKKVLISFLPTAVIGFVLYKVIKTIFFSNSWLMITVFALVGILYILVERYLVRGKAKLEKDIAKLTLKDALIIGLVQSFAVIPGISRAGSVILAMIFLRYNRAQSARYSFMLSIPTILAASGYDLLKMRHVLTSNTANMLPLVIGLVTAFVSSYIVIKWFIDYLKKNSLEVFGWYRLAVVILILLLGLVNK